jgi:hypothetical protein
MGMVQIVFSSTNEQSREIATNTAILAQTLGGSAEDANNIANLFRLMNKTTGVIGTNLIGGFEAMAKANGVTKASIFKQIAGATADIYKFSSGTADNFVKQAISLTKMGVQMSQMAKASDAMVLNYKDSIKNEMQLSAMMGRNVDLSEARAQLMSGDFEGGAQAIRNALGDMDIASMNAFQKQALSQATGMDISAIMGLMQGGEGGAEGKLTENEKIGQMIAQGALKEEIHHAEQKMGLEQAQRKTLLEFEQKERLIMLQIEQQNRLQNLAIEQKYRIKYANLQKEEDINMMVAQMQASVAEGFTTNLISGAAGDREVTDHGVYSKNANLSKEMGDMLSTQSKDITNLIKGGFIEGNDTRLAKVYSAMMDKNKSGDTNGLADVFNKTFGPEMDKYNKALVIQTADNKAKYDALMKYVQMERDITAGKDGAYYGSDSNKALIAELKSSMPETFKQFQGTATNYGKGYSEERAMGYLNQFKGAPATATATGTPSSLSGHDVAPGIAAPNPEAQKAAVTEGNVPTVEALATQTEEQKASMVKQLKSDAQWGNITMTNSKIALKADTDAATTMYTQLNELLAMTGLSLEFLNDIAESNRSVTDVTLDGARVGSLLNEVTRKQFGVVRAAAVPGT